MNLTEPMLLRHERSCRDGSVIVRATPLRFIPFHSSGSHPPEIRMEAAECPNAPQPTNMVRG